MAYNKIQKQRASDAMKIYNQKKKQESMLDKQLREDSSTRQDESIDYEAWTEFISYYRYYIDEFATDILGLKLFPFQRVILRAMARYDSSMLIACRGLGKSFICAIFFICMAILYPNIKLGICSGNAQQAKNVIIQKIKGELMKNPNISREICNIRTSGDDCVVEFNNGSEVRAIVLAQDRGGDGARSWRFNCLLVDEARLVKDNIVEEILIPMTKTKRQAAIEYGVTEKGKIIFITSAHLKTSPIYKRFMYHYQEMIKGNKQFMAICFPYQVGVQAGLFDMDDIEKERQKPTMTSDKFKYEYCGEFVGSSGESYYTYEITSPCRTLTRGEKEQPKNTTCLYVITHDVAVSNAKNSDNACTHVIKLKQRPNGTYTKSVVYTKVMNGKSLKEQRDFLRELVHLKFPNCCKLVIDERGSGNGLPTMLAEPWEYEDTKTGQVIEFPPLIKDNDPDGFLLENAIPLIRAINATNEFNNTFYPYMKSCFEDRSLELLCPSEDVDADYKSGKITAEDIAQHFEHDTLQAELSNIKQEYSESGNLQYTRIVRSKKRDRATSLFYGLSVVFEMENYNRQNLFANKQSQLDLLMQYTFL